MGLEEEDVDGVGGGGEKNVDVECQDDLMGEPRGLDGL